jgi:hypothetical protein
MVVRFAIEHNLCISVASTGHEMLRRHTCKDGIMIKTTFLKTIEWDITDSKGFGHPEGNIKVGSGIVFSEI